MEWTLPPAPPVGDRRPGVYLALGSSMLLISWQNRETPSPVDRETEAGGVVLTQGAWPPV